jgi:copper chaperone
MTTDFLVEGMSCGHCINAVTQAVHTLDPAAQVDVNLDTRHVRIQSEVDRFVLSQALQNAGYTATLTDITSHSPGL